jgi:hypothetical protein
VYINLPKDDVAGTVVFDSVEEGQNTRQQNTRVQQSFYNID